MVFTLPMFPLGTVLVPGATIPLHVFEPRYRLLARHVTEGDGRFGVVLIERGSEVGGGDERVGVGTVAVIREAEEFPDGRWGLVADGTERLRVISWLDDGPYPRAEVDLWPDPDEPPVESVHGAEATLAEVVRLARRLGHDVPDPPATRDVGPETALWWVIASSPLGPADRQELLACPDATSRSQRATSLLAEQRDTLAALVAEYE